MGGIIGGFLLWSDYQLIVRKNSWDFIYFIVSLFELWFIRPSISIFAQDDTSISLGNSK